MSSKTLILKRLTRYPKAKYGDELLFEKGVNLIIGEKDSGKTKWLTMLNYLLGDIGSPEEALGTEIATAYHTIETEIQIGDETITLRRSWAPEAFRNKISVNGENVNAGDLSEFLLDKLSIPKLNFPQGNMFSERSWPTLTFRMLLRHIYRQERFWSDLADRQPESEQHACLALFLGLAEGLFPTKLGDLVRTKKRLQSLQVEKAAHQNFLHELVTDMFRHKEMSVSITEESLKETINRVHGEISGLDKQRQQLLESVRQRTEANFDSKMQLTQKRINEVQEQISNVEGERRKVSQRLSELKSYSQVLQAESERFDRVELTNSTLADIKVTHCPVCDQAVQPRNSEHVCYLCHRDHSETDTIGAKKRVVFEKDQIQEERLELNHLVIDMEKKLGEAQNQLDALQSEVSRLQADLLPAQEYALSYLPPDIALIDQSRGRLNAQLESLAGVAKSLTLRKKIIEQIDALTKEEEILNGVVSNSKTNINLGSTSLVFENKINRFLNHINIADKTRWKNGPVSFQIKDRYFVLSPQNVGGTSRALLYFAYHYALLSLVAEQKYFYPGLTIVDFPLKLADGDLIRDKENYLIEPFIGLCKEPGMENVQVIAAGHAFDGIEGAHVIHVSRPVP